MERILRSLNLGTLVERFQAERIEAYTVTCASDQELNRVGVGTIGDRIRLRDACRKSIQAIQLQEGQSSSSDTSTVRQERLAIFNPRQNVSAVQGRTAARTGSKRKATRSKPWTCQFICMADSVCSKTPTSTEKQILFKAGLGLKKVKLDMEDDEQVVIAKITSDAKDNEGNDAGFPQLKTCGGFEMMRCLPSCRDLTLINCTWSAKDIRANLGGGQVKIYLRPIQRSLSTKPLVQQSESVLKERCYMCNQEILIRQLRDHLWTCTEGLNSSDEDPGNSREEEENIGTETSTNSNRPSTSTTVTRGNSDGASGLNVSQTVPLVDLTTQNTSDNSESIIHLGADDNADKSLDEIVSETVILCQEREIKSSVEILRCFQQKLVTGRQLEVTSDTECSVGETNFIMVDRNNLLETAFEEIKSLQEYRKTLQVQFYGEEAEDYGGPRKEFFRIVLKKIKETYFDNGLREFMKENYEVVGILFGLSIVQNGKIPDFMGEEMLQKIFINEASLQPCIAELQNGFKKVGIYQIGCQLPLFLDLLKPGPPRNLTVRTLAALLKAEFSENGSNKRRYENEVYAQFMKYMRESASGRRNGVALAHILQFATGAEEEPVLGFAKSPCLKFVEAGASFLPTANTCICSLNLPHATNDIPLPEPQRLFGLYDLAFSNAFFGHV